MKRLVLFRTSSVSFNCTIGKMAMTFQDTRLKTRWLALEIGLNAKKRDRRQWEIIAAVTVDASYHQQAYT